MIESEIIALFLVKICLDSHSIALVIKWLLVHSCEVTIVLVHCSLITVVKVVCLDWCDEVCIDLRWLSSWQRSHHVLLLIFGGESVFVALSKVNARLTCQIAQWCLNWLLSCYLRSFRCIKVELLSHAKISCLGLCCWQLLFVWIISLLLIEYGELWQLGLAVERGWVLSEGEVRPLEVVRLCLARVVRVVQWFVVLVVVYGFFEWDICHYGLETQNLILIIINL